MKGTAWELLLLVKDIWSKQGCILWLLINADLPWCAWKQSYGRSDQKEPGEIKENGSCQAFHLTPPGQEQWPLLPRGMPAFVFHHLLPSGCQKDDRPVTISAIGMVPGEAAEADISAWTHWDLRDWDFISLQLCFLSQDTNLSFQMRPSGTAIIRPSLLCLS